MKVLLIDYWNLFIRNFAVNPAKNSETGEHAGALDGVLTSLKFLIRQFNPDKVVICCDGSGGSIRRKKIYENYKAGRAVRKRLTKDDTFATAEDEKKSMYEQYNRLLEYIKILPFGFIRIDYIEADDTIAYISSFHKDKDNYVIVSTDKDFYQLISDNCVVWSPIQKVLYDEKTVREKWFNMNPLNFSIYRSFTGDNSDEIEGIKGFGSKTILKVLPILCDDKQYIMKDIFEYCEQNRENNKGKVNWYDVILQNKEKLEMNYKLCQLYEVDVGLPLLNEIITNYNKFPETTSLFKLRSMFTKDKLFRQIKYFNDWAKLISHLINSNKA